MLRLESDKIPPSLAAGGRAATSRPTPREEGGHRLVQPESPLPGVSRKAGELARQPCRLVKAAGRMPSPSRRLAALQAAFPEVPIALPWAGQGTPG